MSTAVAELGRSLESMLALPPPGITTSKVNMITSLCYQNIRDEVTLTEKICSHFMVASVTHKLGVLYVIDSITRHWVEATRRLGRPPRSAAPDGTLAAGVDRITKSLPPLMTDIISHAPLNQKGEIAKLIDNWEQDDVFPPSMLTSFRKKLSYPLPTSSWNFETEQSPKILVSKDEGASSVPETTNGPLIAAEDNDQTQGDERTAAVSPPLNTSHVVTEGSPNPGYIKVLSRTIVVHGIFSEYLASSFFAQFGRVQNFFNYMNSRAFVKMTSHEEAMNAREGIGSCRVRGIQSVRWYSDFMSPSYMDTSTGISIIPIRHLSRIEHEWLLTAKHGGTRGHPIRSGMVLEAPDTDLSIISRIFQSMSRDIDLNM